jgi:DNA-binding NarL/FixJ family response regulator
MRYGKGDRSNGAPLPGNSLDAPRDEGKTEVPMPAGLRASRVELAGESYVVFSYPTPQWDLPDTLTAAERKVAHAVISGATNEEIASSRASSVRTVAHQVASIYAKMGVSSRAELASKLASLTRKGRS